MIPVTACTDLCHPPSTPATNISNTAVLNTKQTLSPTPKLNVNSHNAQQQRRGCGGSRGSCSAKHRLAFTQLRRQCDA